MNLGTVAVCLARTLLCTLHRLSRPFPLSFVFRERNLHMLDLKARKLARLPGDKCRGEGGSHADIGCRLLPSSAWESCRGVAAPPEVADRSLPLARVHVCIVHTHTHVLSRAHLLTYRGETRRTLVHRY